MFLGSAAPAFDGRDCRRGDRIATRGRRPAPAAGRRARRGDRRAQVAQVADAAGRQKIYDLLGGQGRRPAHPPAQGVSRRLAPTARRPPLPLRRPRTSVPDKGACCPWWTPSPASRSTGPTARPSTSPRSTCRRPSRRRPARRRRPINDLLSQLSLLDPDPAVAPRKASARSPNGPPAASSPADDRDDLVAALGRCRTVLTGPTPPRRAGGGATGALTAIDAALAEKPTDANGAARPPRQRHRN